MAEHAKEIEAIAKNPDKPSFENTIVAMEKAGQLLARDQPVFFNLTGTNTNPELQKLQREIAPKLAAHGDAITLDPALFARVAALYEARDALKLDPESKRLLWRYHRDFVRAGAKLSDADKQKLKAMNAELATLQAAFTQNVLKEVAASSVFVGHREELAGPDRGPDRRRRGRGQGQRQGGQVRAAAHQHHRPAAARARSRTARCARRSWRPRSPAAAAAASSTTARPPRASRSCAPSARRSSATRATPRTSSRSRPRAASTP